MVRYLFWKGSVLWFWYALASQTSCIEAKCKILRKYYCCFAIVTAISCLTTYIKLFAILCEPNYKSRRLLNFCVGARLRICASWFQCPDIHRFSWASNHARKKVLALHGPGCKIYYINGLGPGLALSGLTVSRAIE